ncbi:M4 family metallopeptidase, partial [Streptosporangium sandarakinum]
MRRRAVLAATLGLAVVAAVAPSSPAAAKPSPGPADHARSLHVRSFADPPQLAVAAADQAVASGLDDLRKGPDEIYRRTTVVPGSEGMYSVVYERTYKGLPVVGGDAVVITDSAGRVRDTAAASGATPKVTTSPKVTAEDARTKAKSRLTRVDDSAEPRLVVLAWGAKPRLAWEALVSGVAGGKPSRQHVFVDARTGEIADAYDEVRAGTGNGYYYGQVTLSTSGSGSSYSMTDPTRSGIRCGGQNGSAYTGTDDAWGNGSGTNLETACVDALYSVQKEWDMLRDWLGRNGINGSGGGFPTKVGLSDVNAYWDGSTTNFGHTQDNQRQATSIDVVAHEFGQIGIAHDRTPVTEST